MSEAHAPQWQAFESALLGTRLHHAWILSGRRGLGKHAFARRAAEAIVAVGRDAPIAAQDPDIQLLTHLPKDDKEAKKRDKGEPFETKRNIAIDQIRRMQGTLTTRPTLGPRRAIIIDPADDLERNAANALLKSLEEPPEGTFFLLVTHRPGMLLPTIRSRARMLRFSPLSADSIARELQGSDISHDLDEITAAARSSGGSPGVARTFLEQDLAPIEALMRRIVTQGDPDFALRGQLAGEIGQRPDRARLAATMELGLAVLARQLDTPEQCDIPSLVDAHAKLVTLAGQAPSYNFDPAFLAMEIGTLLASAAPNRAKANV